MFIGTTGRLRRCSLFLLRLAWIEHKKSRKQGFWTMNHAKCVLNIWEHKRGIRQGREDPVDLDQFLFDIDLIVKRVVMLNGDSWRFFKNGNSSTRLSKKMLRSLLSRSKNSFAPSFLPMTSEDRVPKQKNPGKQTEEVVLERLKSVPRQGYSRSYVRQGPNSSSPDRPKTSTGQPMVRAGLEGVMSRDKPTPVYTAICLLGTRSRRLIVTAIRLLGTGSRLIVTLTAIRLLGTY
jgi:hypothetical protein